MRIIKIGEIKKGWWNEDDKDWDEDEYVIFITKIFQIYKNKKWIDVEKDTVLTKGGFKNIKSALEELEKHKIKKIINKQ